MSGIKTPTSSSSPTTRSATDAWSASPILAWTVRVVLFAIPILAAWMAVNTVSGSLYRPEGKLGLVFWIAQALVIGTVTSLLMERLTRRFVPLASLLNMSLVFPDQAPSRFGLALRSGTVRQQQRKLAQIQAEGLGSTEGEAAEQAIELVGMLSQHDRLTRGHTERVRAYADLIAEEMGLSTQDRQKLAWGSMLHDIGKMTVPPEILNKDGRPDEEEWAILQGHPAAGKEFLAPLADWLEDWVLAASEHHERWDGSGYPLGLAGAEISLAGRITSVADAYDVMTARRSYKPPMPVPEARQELVACAGTQFDPEVVRAFLNVSLTRKWRIGPLAWLAELPGFASGGAAVPSMVATSTVVAGSVALGAIAGPLVPDSLPFEEATVVVTTTEVSAESTSTTIEDEAAPTSTPTTSAQSTTIEISTTTETSATGEETTTTEGSSRITTSTTRSTTTSFRPPTSTTTTTQPTTTSSTTTTQPTTTAGGLPLVDDEVDVSGDTTKIFVLSNDDSGGTGFSAGTLEITVPPSHAEQAWVQGDHIRYIPDEDYVGTDYLEYRVCNSAGVCGTAGVTITITDD